MNEKLKELYSYLKRQNATDLTIEQFFAAYGNDRNKAKDVYDFVKSQQMTDLKESDFFNAYFGNAETPQPEVKKKDEGMGLPSEDGSSVSSKTNVVEGTSGFVSEQIIFGEDRSTVDTQVVDPFEQTSQITEKDFFTGTFGNILRAIDRVSPIGIGDFIDDQARAIAGGSYQGILAENASDLLLAGSKASDEDIESYLEALRDSQKYGSSDEFMEYQKIYQEHGEGILGVVLGLAHTGVTVIPEILLNSYTAMIENKDSRYAWEATILGGAGIAATTGTVVGPGGTFVGAAAGAVAALPFAFAAAGSAMEFGSTFSELLLEEAGNRKLTKELIADILNDEEAYKRIRNKAITRGLTIGVIDAITGKMGGKLTTGILTKGGTQAAKQATKKEVLKAVVGSSLVEGGGGSVGEAAARALIGQDMDVSEIALEGIAEMPGSVKSFAQTALSTPTYKVNGSSVSIEVIDDLINTMTLDEIVQGNIEISNDYNGMEFKLQERIKKLKAEGDIILANPNINKPTLDKISELQLELDKLKVNDTEVSKQRSASIRAEIKNLQENQLEGTVEETTKTSYNSLSPEDKMELRTKALDELEKEGVESPTNKDIDIKAVSILDKELQLLEGKPKKKKKSFVEGLGKTKDIGDVMEGGIEVDMDGTKVIITEDEKGVTLESIETEDGKKGQGNAEAAIKQITEKADRDGVDVTLKVVPNDKTVDAKRLQSLYERNGFKMQEDGVTMVRSVNTFDNVSDNLFINRKDSSPLLGLIPQKTKSFAMTAAKLAAKAIRLIAPEVKIVLHESEGEYLKYTSPLDSGEVANSGEYNPETNTIHINLSNVKKSTVAHEVFHAVLLNKLKNNDALAKKISDDMVRVVQRRLPKNHKLRVAVEAHAAKYQGVDAQFQTEEQIAELIGLLSSKEDGYTQLDNDMKSVIKRFLINLAKKLNIPLPKNWGSDQEVVDLINTLSRKTRTGEAITESDVKLLDVKEDTEDGGEFVENPANVIRQQKVGNFEITYTENDKIAQYIKDGRITEPKNILDVFKGLNTSNVKVLVHSPDDMLAGEIKYKGKTIFEGSGGLFFVTKFGEVWASTEGAAVGIVNGLNKQVEEQGRGFMLLAKGSDQKLMSSPTGVDGAMKVINKMVGKNEIFSPSEFRTAVSKAISEEQNRLRLKAKKDGKKVPKFKPFSLRISAADMMSDITKLFSDESSGTFETRGNIVKGIGNALASAKLTSEQQSKAAKFLGGDTARSVGVSSTENKKTGNPLSQGLSDLIALTLAEKLTKGLKTGDVYAVIEVNQKVKATKSKHPSYDTSIVTLDGNPPILHLLKNRQPGKEVLTPIFGKDKNKPYSVGQVPTMTGQINLEKKAEDKGTNPIGNPTPIVNPKSRQPATRQQKGIEQAMENGEVIQTDSELIFFKGMQPKMKNGKPFSVHKIKKGSFAALDKNIALDYKGDKPLKQFTIPKGTTVEVVNLPSDAISLYRINEEKAINASEAQVVKLVTTDLRGKSQQYVIKDAAILKTSKDVKESSVTSNNKKTFTARQQKGLINFSEKDAIKFSKIGVDDARTIQAMNSIGLSGVKFTEEGVNKKIKESLDELYGNYKSYLLSIDGSEITRLMQFEIDAAIEDALPDNVINQLKEQINNDKARKDFISNLRKTQDDTADQWVSYLKQSEYSDAFKYLMLDAVLTNNYDLKSLNYNKRTKATTRNISPFDAGTLAMLYASDSKALLKSYVEMQKENLDNIINASQVKSTEGGKWLKFDGGPNAANKEETANSLSQLVQDTYWCTKTNALGQLRGGDFYVYVTGGTPRIAIRMEGDRVGEVRGNASSKQDLEPDMLPVADEFLKDNIPNDSGKKWLDSIAFNKKAKEFLGNIKANSIGEKEIKEYVNIVSEGEKNNTDYGENGFVTKIKNAFQNKNNIKPDIREFVAFNFSEFDANKTKYFIGSADFKGSKITDLGSLEIISGDAYFEGSNVKSLGSLESIGGSAHFRDSNVESLGSLERIGGDAYFLRSKIADLGSLESIGGNAYFEGSNVKSLGSLESIGGSALFKGSKITDLGSLKSIGGSVNFTESNVKSLGSLERISGNAFFTESNVESLGSLKSIGGDAYFRYSNIESLGSLESIGGHADFKGSKIADLGSLESIGGNAYFSGSKITDLGSLESIGGSVNFAGSNVKSLGSLKSIGGSAHFRDSNVESLGSLERIGRYADFERSNVADLGSLKSIGGNADFADSKITDLGSLESIGGNAYFKGSNVKSLGSLKSIGGNAHFRDSNVESLGSLERIGGNADFERSNVADLGSLKSIGGNAYFSGSKITDLGSLESIGGDAYFLRSKIADLGSLESIGGNAYFEGSNVKSLGSLKSIGGNADFERSNVKSLGSLESIGGSAHFRDSNVESLGSLERIGGDAYFLRSKIADLGSLESIGGDAYFRYSNVESLGSLKSIGGNAYFSGSKLENEWNSIKNKPASRQSKSDVESFIKNARAQGISEAAIKIILANKGVDEKTIANALSKTKGGASGTVKVDESFVEGYDTTMKVIDGIIKKTKAKFAKEDTSPQTLLDSTLPYLQGSKVYENATDVQREKMVRNLRKKVGLKEKSSPSISKILGKVKDVKNILVSEKELLIKRIKDVREGAITTIKAIKLAQKEIINGVKDLKKKGKINTTQLTNIISKLNRIDMLSESDVNEFFDYMAKVFNDAEYVEKLKNANNKRKNALKNIPKKIGIADSIAQSLVKIFSINPSLIPDAVFDKYLKLVDQFGERASVLTLSSVKVVEKTASEILNQIDIETSKIPQLQEYLESFEKKVIDSETGKLNYAETIKQMLADEVINESDYEVMKKYKSGILAKEEKASKTDAEILQEKKEILQEKKEIIKRLKRRDELNVENLPSRFEVERARRFKELIKDSEILMRLSVNQLKQIEKLVGNIRNGYFPSLANEMIVKLEGELNGNKLSKGIKEGKLLPKARLKSNLRKLFGAGNSILKEIKSTPLFFIDQVFGNFKESLIRNSLFDGLAKQIQQFESSYKKISGRIEKAQLAVFKSFKNRPNEALMSNFKQMVYLIQLEYDTNIGNPETKHQAKAYIEKTIKAIDDGASTYSDRDAEMLSTILKDFTENKEISLDKLYGSFNSAEKNSIKVIQEVNAELGPIAQQTANVIRGEGITARNNYVHLNVINEKGSDPMANEAFIDGYTKSLKPSTRSKSLIKRQGVVSPLNFDVYTSALKGAKGTLLDFHMTDAVRTANATLNSTEGLLKGNEPRMSSENREKFNAIKEAYDTVLRIQFTNAYFSTTFVEDALNWVSKNGYRTMLAGSVRLISEFSSNSAFALLTNPKALISGVKIGIGFLNSDAAPEVMSNLNSTQTNRIYPNEDLSGRMIDTNLLNKKKGLKGARAKNKYMNKLTQVWNATGDKYVNSVATLADSLISSPDKAIMRPVWFGAFSNEFKKITGLEPNLDKIAANDTNYMDANKEALDSATKHADEQSIYTGATSNPFYGILRGQSMPTDTSFKKAYNAFNNFMLTFLMYEYMTVRTGVVSAMGQGSLSKTKGASLVAASATRMTMYTMMISVMGELMSNIVGGDDEEKDIKSLDKRLGQSIASTVLTISLGKSGNAYRSVINFLADGANEEYLDMLRDGEYDVYKDGLSFQTIPKEKNRGTGLADILLNSFAAYGPAVKTVDFIIKKSTEPEKKTDAAKERRKKELMYRLPLEVLGNTGLIPMYKDVRKVVLGRIYNDIGSGSQEQKNYQKEVEKMKTSFGNGGFGNGGFGKDAGGFGNPK
jgi:hypothetical protein